MPREWRGARVLTKSDKAWLRKTLRAELAAIVEGLAASQIGGYDGATHVEDEVEDEGEEGRKRIGFTVSEQASSKLD